MPKKRTRVTSPAPANTLPLNLNESGTDDISRLYDTYHELYNDAFELAVEAQKQDLTPYLAYALAIQDSLSPTIETIEHRNITNIHEEGFNDYCVAIACGRGSRLSVGDTAFAEERLMQSLAATVANQEFGDKYANYFERGGLTPRHYRNVVNRLGKQMFDSFEEEGEFGRAESDHIVFPFMASAYGLLVAAIMSESSATRQKAIDHFTLALNAINEDRPPGAQEAVYLGRLVGQVMDGEKTVRDIQDFKEVLGEDWEDCLTHYAILNLLIRYRRQLREPENLTEVAKHLKKWFDTNMAMVAVAQRHNDLYEIARHGSDEDHVDTDGILDTGELFAQLDWTVLPPGEKEMIKEAEDIVAGAHGEVKIDLERLNVLKAVKDAWGADRSYYARGRLKSPRKVSVDGQEHPDEYIVLVLQQLDDSGNVVYEHAIAESPIAGPNAMYVFRSDVAPDHSWREVYSLPKKEARRMGARAVKHTTVGNKPLIETMTEKVTYLITCQPEEFAAIEFNGKNMIRFKKIGELTTPTVVDIDAAA